MIGTNRYIGSPVERIEDLRFLRGRGEFVGDLQRGGMLRAAILRSPIAHGRIRGLDSEPARAIPGVRAVITAAEIGAVRASRCGCFRYPGRSGSCSRSLQRVACVMSASQSRSTWRIARRRAGDGVGAIVLDVEELPPVADR